MKKLLICGFLLACLASYSESENYETQLRQAMADLRVHITALNKSLSVIEAESRNLRLDLQSLQSANEEQETLLAAQKQLLQERRTALEQRKRQVEGLIAGQLEREKLLTESQAALTDSKGSFSAYQEAARIKLQRRLVVAVVGWGAAVLAVALAIVL